MKNRALELAMLKGINTAREFAKAVDIPLEDAVALLNEEKNVIINPESINKCLKYFNCTYEYFMCLID